MNTRSGPCASERDDLLDLGEREPQASSLRYECQQTQHVRRI
jgi:hypothetical protein